MNKTPFRLLSCLAILSTIPLRAQAPAAAPAAQPAPSPFAASLALRTDRVVTDSTRPALGWLTQTSPVAYTAKGALTLKVFLAAPEGDAKPVKALGIFTIYGGDLARSPVPFPLDLNGVADGYYRCMAELWEGSTNVATLEKPIVLVAGIEEKQTTFAKRVAKISGHESAKATVLYPFDLARVMNLGKRVYGSNNRNPEFGMSQAGVQVNYDFSSGIKKSAELLTVLEAGKDPVWRVGGEHVRHYQMKEADEILPYRVFIPSTWDGKSPLPLVFVMHGNSRDQDFYFERDDRVIPKAAEKRGFMLVAPLGYAPNAGYNYVPFNQERGTRGVAAALAAAQQFGPAVATGGGGRGGNSGPIAGGVNGSTTPALVRAEWSEQDAMHVFELIKQEYPIDPKRTFLFGYSAGGQGGHYFAQKYAENWAAVAIGGSGAAVGPYYATDRLKNIPVMVFAGSADPVLGATKKMGQDLQAKGVDATVKEYEGATHDTAPSKAIGDILDFFLAHGRK